MIGQGRQGDGLGLQIGNAGGAGQGGPAVDGTGAGAAGGMVAAVAVHQCGIQGQADLFQSVENRHIGDAQHRKIL